MTEKTALGMGATGVAMFGLTLAELGEIAQILAGVAGAIASVAAAIYYIKKTWWDK